MSAAKLLQPIFAGLCVLAAAAITLLNCAQTGEKSGGKPGAQGGGALDRLSGVLRKKPSMTTVLAIVVFAWVVWELNHARKMVTSETYRISAVHPLGTDPAILEVVVSDKSERTYALAIDVEGKRRRYLCRSGRLAPGSLNSASQTSSKLLFIHGGEPGTGMLGPRERSLAWLPETDERIALPPPAADESRMAPASTWFTGVDHQWFGAVCRSMGRDNTPVIEVVSEFQLFSRSGALMERVPLAGLGSLRYSPDGKIAVMSSAKRAGDRYSYELRIIDAVRDTTRSVSLEGTLLSISDDMRQIANVRPHSTALPDTQPGAASTRPAGSDLEIIDLETLDRRTVLTAEDFVQLEAEGRSPASSLMSWPENSTFRQNIGHFDPCPLRFSRDLACAVWFESNVFQGVRRLRLMSLDIASGRKRVLADESALPVLYADSLKQLHDAGDPYRQTYWILGFTRDLKSVVVQIGDWRYFVDLAGGAVVPLSGFTGDPGVDVAHPLIQFSPSRRRAVVSVSENDNRAAIPPVFASSLGNAPLGRPGEQTVTPTEGVFILDPGQKPRRIFDQGMITQWIDDSRLVVYDNDHCFIVKAEGGTPREIFSPADPDLLKDRWK